MVYICHPDSAKAGKSRVQSQSMLHGETLSQMNKQVNSSNAILNAVEAKGDFQIKITVISNMFEKTLEFVGVTVRISPSKGLIF